MPQSSPSPPTPRTPLHVPEQLQMLALVGFWRIATVPLSLKQAVTFARRASERIRRPTDAASKTDPEASIALAATLAHRASRLVPGSTCVHRALASRLWLAARGIDASVVIGFRKTEVLEGHAWLEIELPGGRAADGSPAMRLMFKSADDGYRPSLHEADLAAEAT